MNGSFSIAVLNNQRIKLEVVFFVHLSLGTIEFKSSLVIHSKTISEQLTYSEWRTDFFLVMSLVVPLYLQLLLG
jgi:hypothetical protein